jgi:hypothetical protein
MTSDRELDALLHAYAAERADDAQVAGTLVALFATSVGLLSLIGFALFHAKSGSVPGWAIALAPLLPIPFIAYGAMLSYVSNVRGKVIDTYEERIREGLGGIREECVPAPFGHTVVSRAWKSKFGGWVIGVTCVVFIGLYVVVLYESFRYAHHSAYGWALGTLVGSSLALLGLIGLTVLAFKQDVCSEVFVELRSKSRKPAA